MIMFLRISAFTAAIGKHFRYHPVLALRKGVLFCSTPHDEASNDNPRIV